MRDKFREYYKPSQEKFDSMWETSLFVPDANVLLHLYEYSTDTREAILKLFQNLTDRMWLPHQCAKEYHKNRLDTINDEVKKYDAIKQDIKKIVDTLQSTKHHPFVCSDLMKEFTDKIEEVQGALQAGKGAHEKIFHDDPICEKVTKIFEGRVGEKFGDEEISKIYAEGKKRYEHKIPPGYKDMSKPEPDRYGDLILWKQLISKAKESGKGIVFITDDEKEDWWYEIGSTRIGPRPELLREFYENTEMELYIYTAENFYNRAKERKWGEKISETVVEEVKEMQSVRNKITHGMDNTAEILKSIAIGQRFAESFQNQMLKSDEATKSVMQSIQSQQDFTKLMEAMGSLSNPILEYDKQLRSSFQALANHISLSHNESIQKALQNRMYYSNDDVSEDSNENKADDDNSEGREEET